MTDTWGCKLYAADGTILWQGAAEKQDIGDLGNLMSRVFHTYIRTRPNVPLKVCDIDRAEVIKNHFVYAVVDLSNNRNHTWVGASYGTFGFCVEDGHLIASESTTTSPLACTCGVQKFTGGMCSDWCDLVRKQ
jgi:hypothetical protein